METKKRSLDLGAWSVYLFILAMSVFFFVKPKEASAAALSGFNLWLQNVLPALFPFFVISAFMANCKLMRRMQPMFEPLMRKVFGLSGGCAFGYLVSLFSGYPVGTKTVCEMYKTGEIDRREATVLLNLCSNGGPIFVVSTVGALFYQNAAIAIILLIVNYVSAFAVGFIYSRAYSGGRSSVYSPVSRLPKEKIHYAEAFTKAVTVSIGSIINVGAFIIFFSVIIQLFVSARVIDSSAIGSGVFNAKTLFSSIVISVLELTAGTKAFSGWAEARTILSVSLSSFAVGFGGLCVFFQSASFVSDTDLSMKTFFIGKLIQSAVAFALGFGISSFALKADVSCFNPSGFTFGFSYDWAVFAAVMIGIALVAWYTERRIFKRK